MTNAVVPKWAGTVCYLSCMVLCLQFGNLNVTPCMSQYDSMQLQAVAEICERTMLSDGINTHLLFFLCGFMPSIREINCHTVYVTV
jgi:hypothetical protein